MTIPMNVAQVWNDYSQSVGGIAESRFYEAFFFGDNEGMADGLAALVLSGIKRATAGSLWSFEAEGKRLPIRGDLSIITNWARTPQCVIEAQSVEVLRFAQVTQDFASAEGEGDGSLAFWRDAHKQYFTRECALAGREFSEDMLIVCERFHVVFRPSTSAV